MLLLLIDALLLSFISFAMGKMARAGLSQIFRMTILSGFMEDFILGLMATGVYCNILSFFIPVNYLVLIPLLMLSGYWFWKDKGQWLFQLPHHFIQLFRQRPHGLLLCLTLGVIAIYCFVPPINHDSADYHYQAVYWYENQKLIPGLGNIHGRLAFNAISFILSAPYSFTTVAGQSLYPLNGVLVAVFYIWLLQLIIQRKNKLSSIVYLVTGIFLFRPLLANLPSPASEPLVTITVAVVFLKMIQLIEAGQHRNPAQLIIPVLISFFAITAKLTSLPLLLLPAVWMLFIIPRQHFRYYAMLFVGVLMVLVPWLARNVVMSGYLLYPLYQVDFFNVDWKMPKDVAVIDYALGTAASKGDIYFSLATDNLFNWIGPWLKGHLRPKKIVDLFVFILCFGSPLLWLFHFIQRNNHRLFFILWLCAFTASVVWLVKAPEYRFGMSFLVVSFAIPFIHLCNKYFISERLFKHLAVTISILVFVYYGIRSVYGHPRLHGNGMETLWLRPLKDKRYFSAVDMKSFRFDSLGNGVKVYYKDSVHDCIIIRNQPCMLWYYGRIEMRGNRISDGFRINTCAVRKTFPYIFTREW